MVSATIVILTAVAAWLLGFYIGRRRPLHSLGGVDRPPHVHPGRPQSQALDLVIGLAVPTAAAVVTTPAADPFSTAAPVGLDERLAHFLAGDTQEHRARRWLLET